MSQNQEDQKRSAYLFLKELEKTFTAKLFAPAEMRINIQEIIKASKIGNASRHLRYPESAFLNSYVIPEIFHFMQTYGELAENEARQALLAEGFGNMPKYCCGSPFRTEGHPFNKVISASTSVIVRKWKNNKTSPLTLACPDFAIREPFTSKIVFEGKYFEKGSSEKAARDLVTDIYQAFFYRALPYVPPKKSGPAWDYDYSCLLAYDASPTGVLLAEWESLSGRVKRGFWEGANVYVMILRGIAR